MRVAVAALVLFLIGGCASPPKPAPGAGDATQPQLSIEGPTELVVDSYALPSGTGYDAAVAFRVTNPNPSLAALDVPYRVSIGTGATMLFNTDGSDLLSVGAGETRLVVYGNTLGLLASRPEWARVELFTSPALFKSAVLPAQDSWSIANEHLACPGVGVQCTDVVDVTWHGAQPLRSFTLDEAVHRDDAQGPIVAAGMTSVRSMAPGQTVSAEVTLAGFEQPVPNGSPVLPTAPLSSEFSFDASTS